MPFKKAKNWKERGLQIQKIKDKCNGILKRLGLPDEDVRAQGLIHVRQMCNTIAHISLALQHQAEKDPSLIANILLLTDMKDLKGLLTDFNQNSKAAYITSVQFALENCIKSILEASGRSAPYTFHDSAKAIINFTKIPKSDEKLKQLMVPAYIRNSLHRNGIHTKQNVPAIVIDGESYGFEKGKRVNCGSWSHLFHLILNILDIYEEIFAATSIRKISCIKSM